MPLQEAILEVYEVGTLTVVGFGGKEVLDNINIVGCRDEVCALIEDQDCKVLAFDLTGVKLIPSGLLGLLASLRELNVEVHLYNPSDDIREVLEITKLDSIMHVHNIDF